MLSAEAEERARKRWMDMFDNIYPNCFLEEATAPGNQKQVTGKLKNPCNSLLNPDSEECKLKKDHDFLIREGKPYKGGEEE